MPATQTQVYLNTGTAGPLPQVVTEAMADALAAEARRGRARIDDYEAFATTAAAARSRLAGWIGAHPDELALTHHTTEGLNIALWGLPWRPGDQVVTTSLEHPGLLVPLYQIHHRLGVEVRVVQVGEGDPEQVLAALQRAMGPRVRAVALSHVAYGTGALLPLAEIARLCRERDAWLVVDGAQAAGAISVDVRTLGVDAYAVPGQKWLCGPEGTGGLYVAGERLGELEVTFSGFSSVAMAVFRPDDPHSLALAAGARRFEAGTVFRPGIQGLAAGLAWLDEQVTPQAVFARTRALARYAMERVAATPGFRLLTPPAAHAGLVSFTVEGADPDACARHLAAEGITIRFVPQPRALRLSCGFFNTEEEIERTLDRIEAFARGK